MFKPTSDYILVKPVERRQSTTLEVISDEKYNRGMVVAVGPGERIKNRRGEETGHIRPMVLKPGDFITYVDLDHIYPKYFEGKDEYRVLQDKDVTFVSDRDFVDQHNQLSDEEIDRLIAEHNRPLEVTTNQQRAVAA
jgi:co-chaperonin GroES (HSP10)